MTELAAELRASAPEAARGLMIDSISTRVNTTQDVAVAVAFLITEIVEFAMLHAPEDPVELSLRRTSELTARLTISSPVLVPGRRGRPEKCSSNGSSAGSPSSCAPPSIASSAATASICLYFHRLAELQSLRPPAKKVLEVAIRNPFAKKGRYAVRIVTFCPPALAIRLNGPGTANPPPPRWRFRALFCLGPLTPSQEFDRARLARRAPVRDADGEDRELVKAVKRHEQHQHRHDVGRRQHRCDRRRPDDRVAPRLGELLARDDPARSRIISRMGIRKAAPNPNRKRVTKVK